MNWRYFFAIISLLLILLLSYSNSFNCSWHFDDYDNITENANIKVNQFTWENIKKISFGIMGNNRISRPVSYLSFALNYYWGGLDVFGYHVVNFLVHYLSAIFLFLLIINTLKLPLLKERYGKHSYSIALLATLFWAINPVQVTAVTYIVQRMASMVALFYIMSMYFYLKFRTSDKTAKSIIFIILCVTSMVLAIGTKENAAMLPASIFLYDLFFIQGLTKENIKRNIKFIIIPLIILFIAALLFYDFSGFSKEYDLRPFTLKERLLTEPRVILFYISLLFYPVTSRLTIIHDIEISKSLFDPWTTAAAILTIILIIVISFIKAKKYPLITFCVLFFFLNHVIEGSIFSLELIFEHRNYLPSMFLFIPLAFLMIQGLDYFYQKKIVFYSLVAAVTSIIIILSMTVYIQNNIMRDEISLWSDNVEKSPRLHHPRQCLAVALFLSGRLPEALKELQQAIKSYESGLINKKSLTYGCIGEYYFITRNNKEARNYLLKSINFCPPYSYIPLSFDRLATILMEEGALEKAEEMSRKALSLQPNDTQFRLTHCAILIKKKQPNAAIKEAQKVLRLNYNLLPAYNIIAEAYALKNNKAAENHFRTISKGASQKSK
ncbi:MAG: hypothetical protein ABFD75_16045 [Smithella sp.]